MVEGAAAKLGCVIIPAGAGQTEMQVQAITELRPDAYVGTPSFLKIIIEKALELGAVDFVAKPRLGIADGMRELAHEITEKIRIASRARVSKLHAPLPGLPGAHAAAGAGGGSYARSVISVVGGATVYYQVGIVSATAASTRTWVNKAAASAPAAASASPPPRSSAAPAGSFLRSA